MMDLFWHDDALRHDTGSGLFEQPASPLLDEQELHPETHGNGTQACFYERDDVLTVSLHMRHGAWGESHPQTCAPDELGEGAGTGFNVNVELPPGTGGGGYLLAFEEIVAPVVDRFSPGLLLVACGQNANQFDPNGRQCVSMEGFRRLGLLPARHAGRRARRRERARGSLRLPSR